jgi:vacuolar-type H+-ATPase subunit H
VNIFTVIESLQREVSESKPLPWPLQQKSLVDRDRLLRILETTRQNLPEEVKQARWISRERERIAQETTTRADQMVKEAQNRSLQILQEAEQQLRTMTSRDEQVHRARLQAEEILGEARQQADELKQEAEHYAFQIVERLEGELTKVLSAVKHSRQALETNLPAPTPPPQGTGVVQELSQ